jgi:glycogen debranching enzyme
MFDVISFRNFSSQPVSFPVTFEFGAGFEDIFVVRGLLFDRPAPRHRSGWKNEALLFEYNGTDNINRSVTIQFSEIPALMKGNTAGFQVQLEPSATRRLFVSISIQETPGAVKKISTTGEKLNLAAIESALHRSASDWLEKQTEVISDCEWLNNIMNRSIRDLHMLRSHIQGDEYFAAGTPWFATLFGRDSIITSIQTLAFDPSIPEQTLRLLAKYQGTKIDELREETPGKILHEYRIDELTNTGDLPYSPYYGSVDSTALFLILIAKLASWTGDLSLFNELRNNVELALRWLDEYGDEDQDRYVEYHSKPGQSLTNQGWKDAGDAIVNVDGSTAVPPIALVEVQGYTYKAKRAIATLYRRAGVEDRADALEAQAEDLRKRFNRDFWLADRGIYALALQENGKPVSVVSSNPGHALWCDIVDEDKAELVVKQLMSEEMFSGWGVRTLSDQERRYNPIGYHLGTVWPHDNAIIAAGFRRYGFDKEACIIFDGIAKAGMHFGYRLPELFAGFRRDEYVRPVAYPVACHPQAWAAGSVPFMLMELLGLVPMAFENRLVVTRPVFPTSVNHLEIKGLRIGKATVDLAFDRISEDKTNVEITKNDGEVIVEIKN